MADLIKKYPRLTQLNFFYDGEGRLVSVSAQVACDIFEGQVNMLTSLVETVPIEMSTGEQRSLEALIHRLTE